MFISGFFVIELRDVESFKKSIAAISSFIVEGNLRFNDFGVHLRGVDPSQVVLVDFSMPKEVFKKFEVEPMLVGVDLVEFNKILSRVQPGETLLLDLGEAELKLTVVGEFEKNFSLPLIESSSEDVTVPKIKFDSSVEISARVLKEVLKDASVFASLVVFSVKKNSFVVEARGSGGTMSGVSKDAKSVKVESTHDVTAKFSLTFLQNIVREVDLTEKVLLELKSDSPAKVTFAIGKNRFEFYLANMIL